MLHDHDGPSLNSVRTVRGGETERQTEMGRASGHIDLAVKVNRDLVERLSVRLLPLLRPSAPSKDRSEPAMAFSTDLPRFIDETAMRADETNNMLADLIERLEV